ncbi:MAG: hypothetical protein KY476_06545 [Planctomycetes bacterium]|nr:hypothetical protein [Planctomycetota bacterium]
MTDYALLSQITSLETQLAVLRAQARQQVAPSDSTSLSPADVYGLLKGQVESTEGDVEAAEFRLELDL